MGKSRRATHLEASETFPKGHSVEGECDDLEDDLLYRPYEYDKEEKLNNLSNLRTNEGRKGKVSQILDVM